MGAEFVGESLHDPDESGVRAFLRSIEPVADGQPLVLVWAGHGVAAPDGALHLLAADSGTDPMDGLPVREVAGKCAQSGAGQLLVVLDACFSGQGVPSATDVASAVMASRPPDSTHVWVGVLASCLPSETAIDGLFGEQLRRLLKDGPTSPHQRRRWSVHNEFVQGEDLGAALVAEWDAEVQQPVFRREGSAWWMFPNPLFDPGAPEVVVEHLLLAARGAAIAEDHSWFTGRRAEVDTVVGWVTSGQPGVRVVTGSAGTGKSAIAGRVVSVANPQERRRLAAQGDWGHADPGERSVAAHVHARGRTADQVAESLDGQLVRATVLEPDASGRRNAAQLVGSLQTSIGPRSSTPPVLVIDGLDEARGQAFTITRDLLTRLAPYAVVVVATRDLPEPGGDSSGSLVGVLDPLEVMDLDDEHWADSGRDALADYVVARLRGVDQRMDAGAVAEQVRRAAFDGGEHPFLFARLVTDQLRANPIDTHTPGWQELVADSMDTAFEQDLAMVPPPSHRTLPADSPPAVFARRLLVALTWGLGAGFPDAEWMAVAAAVASNAIGPADIDWVLDHLGRYVVQDGEDGVAVYKIAHQGLADRLRSFTARPDQPFDPAALPVARALLKRYRDLLAAGVPADQPRYLWYHAWRHAAAAGEEGLRLIRGLAEQALDLRADVAATGIDQAATLRRWGRRAEALPPVEEAVRLYRELAADNPGFVPALATALNNLGIRFAELGRHAEALPPVEEAVRLRRPLAADNPAFVPDLATALNNLGNCYAELGRHAEALPPVEEAVRLGRPLAADNPAFVPDLAKALNNLGNRYAELGRRAEALPPTEEAVRLGRPLAADNPAFVPDLAKALNNLGNRYAELGRRAEALPPTEETVRLCRPLAADNPAFVPDLAMALNNLGACYAELGRHAEALPPTEEAVRLDRELAADNPGFVPDLASALNNLGESFAELGRHAEALPATEEAVRLGRPLAADNPAFVPDLATALNNLGIRFAELGRHAEALPATEEAVRLRRPLAVDNPGFVPDLASALNNLGNCYAELGRHAEALPPTEEAVRLYRELAADNPGFVPALATALNNLGNCYVELGRRAEALPPTEDAVRLARELAADNPAFVPALASALNNLGIRYAELGRHAEALPPTEETVRLCRPLAADNPAFVPALASALNNLGNCYAELGRHAEALPPTEETVRLCRPLAADNPAFVPALASALNNLGNCYAELGRHAEALPPTEDAVRLARELAADNPAFVPALAKALNNLGNYYADLDQPGGAAREWDAAQSVVPPEARSFLLILRSQQADGGDAHAAGWLAEAIDCAGEEPGLVEAIHDEVRRHRASDPQFDLAWTNVTGKPVPVWADIDHHLLAIARDWTYTATYEDECQYLGAHPELLDPSFDGAVEEALLAVPAEEADRYREHRETARVQGTTAAYRPLLLRILATEFANGSPTVQRELLHQRRDDLLDDIVTEVLAQLATDDDSWQTRRALALLDLAANPDQAVLEHVLDALDDPSRFPDLLHSTARGAAQQSDPESLAAVAQCAMSAATSPIEAATAAFYLAVVAAFTDDHDAATGWVNEARAVDPDPTSRDTWITTLAQLGQLEPRINTLIPQLLAPLPSGRGDPEQSDETDPGDTMERV
ncbi:tetratricopeptide repeat protein [Kribbella sp. NBC_01245]|uniref:tetratricopeptide repeat protein n=1 Tax=Kribbella sp. NBC_01245 TaxID=2903578 RepID=UPI002E2E650D|nr:tetratricopeptide repeat protein [Kribbella sp. NBC_01245]